MSPNNTRPAGVDAAIQSVTLSCSLVKYGDQKLAVLMDYITELETRPTRSMDAVGAPVVVPNADAEWDSYKVDLDVALKALDKRRAGNVLTPKEADRAWSHLLNGMVGLCSYFSTAAQPVQSGNADVEALAREIESFTNSESQAYATGSDKQLGWDECAEEVREIVSTFIAKREGK